MRTLLALVGALSTLAGAAPSYTLATPKGWVLDNQIWAPKGIRWVFYPAGSGPGGNLYAFVTWVPGRGNGFEALAKEEFESLKESSQGHVSTDEGVARSADGRRVFMKSIHMPMSGTARLIGYVELPGGAAQIVLHAIEPMRLSDSRAVFESLVRSFRLGGGESSPAPRAKKARRN